MASIDDLKSSLSRDMEKVVASGEGVSLGRVEFVADTIDEILEEACRYFNTSRINLDYEVIQRFRGGFLGLGRRPFKLLVWLSARVDSGSFDEVGVSSSGFSSLGGGEELVGEGEDITGYIDGGVKITVRKKGIFINVSSPRAGGKAVSLKDAQFALANRNIRTYSLKRIEDIVDKASGEDVKIGDWVANANFDSSATVVVSADEMLAHVTVSAPILAGRRLEEEEIHVLLKSKGIVFGVLAEEIASIFEESIYGSPVLVAQGDRPINGANARIDYRFLVNDKQVKFAEDASGKVDYKQLDLLQNVLAGQVLAVKVSATKGRDGRTVLNNIVETVDGEDISFVPGENTRLSENGLEIISRIAGRATIRSGLVCVDPVYEVKGDVNLNTGNIIFLGTVRVNGSVLDGFSVKAAGDIEVRGSVGRTELEADGEIVVGQGILGKDGGSIKAGTNIFAKFIENANVYAGNDVIVKEEILHSKVDACGRIICHGKKGIILGGKLRAGYEISAKRLGSNAYTNTMLEAGVDPKYKEKLVNLEEELELALDQLSKINANIRTLQRQKDAGVISEDKGIMLGRFIEAKSEFEVQCVEIRGDIEELNSYLDSLDNNGRISAKVNIFPGVDITIKSANLFIKNDFKKVSFVNKNNLIKSVVYEPFEGEHDLGKLK